MIPAMMHVRTRNAPSVARLDTCEEKLLAEEVQEYRKSQVKLVPEDYVSEFLCLLGRCHINERMKKSKPTRIRSQGGCGWLGGERERSRSSEKVASRGGRRKVQWVGEL